MNIELTPELEVRLQQAATRQGVDATSYALQTLDHALPPRYLSASQLLKMPREERDRYLRQAAEEAAPLYNADLALPAEQRELTAFTILDGEPFLEDTDEDTNGGA